MSSTTRSLFAWILAGSLAGCGEEPPPPRFPVTFTAESDPGQPLAAVRVSANGSAIGETGPDGVLRVDLTGPEGVPVQIGAACPEGHRDPTSLPTLSLRRVVSLDPTALSPGLQVSIPCPPRSRRGVVVVRAGGEPPPAGLPVLLEGREVARTDAAGVAHFALDMPPAQTFQVRLATDAFPTLRPQSPVATFTFPDDDEIFVLDQPFQIEPPVPPRPRRPRRTPPPTPAPQNPTLPVRIGRQ